MEIGLVGLGRMGGNIARRLMRDGHQVRVFARRREAVDELVAEGAAGAYSIEELAQGLSRPRAVWLMVPAGEATEENVRALTARLEPDDVLIEGGNSYFKDSVVRAQRVREKGIHYLDVGTSGGIWGLEIGYCLMIGGEEEAFHRLEPVFKTLAPENGYAHVGPNGAGHFVKMVHNGIEYGMLQAYAEGFEILHTSTYPLDLRRIAELWNSGSVVRSWLLELAERALSDDPQLSAITDYVEDSGEGRWTVMTAIEQDVPATVLAHSLFARFRSRQEESFGGKLIAALRQQFGGHRVIKT